MTAWEHAQLNWFQESETIAWQSDRRKELSEKAQREWQEKGWGASIAYWKQTVTIHRAGSSEREVHVLWETGDGDEVRQPDLYALIGKLGADGWELVTSFIVSSSAFADDTGQHSRPRQLAYVFKRPAG